MPSVRSPYNFVSAPAQSEVFIPEWAPDISMIFLSKMVRAVKLNLLLPQKRLFLYVMATKSQEIMKDQRMSFHIS
ncbi:hypothetical protein A3SI_19666 [Nitritalea halalkaliphila LW7]|uniref:Uncharacterized protein n=1 Tax=Nitritalea halalkaliphila LW7 TaxID=1189621 RepID=I5BSM3_9BACT|nr:hypothetical protein A3SI_19666 [Nitritalea halalkaliphila LW7]